MREVVEVQLEEIHQESTVYLFLPKGSLPDDNEWLMMVNTLTMRSLSDSPWILQFMSHIDDDPWSWSY